LLFLGFAVAVSGDTEGFAVVDAVVDANVGLLFCASASVSLTFEPASFLSHGEVGGHVECWPLEMLVSVAPLFLGGGGISGPNVCGRYADSVIKGRLDDCALGRKEEKGHRCALRQCAHLLVAAGCAANRKIVEIDGEAVRRLAMVISINPGTT